LQEQSDPARIPALVAEQHRDLVETYNVFIIGDEKGRELDQIRIGPQERVAANDALNAAMPIIEAVEAAEGVATARAIETLRDHAHAELTATSGIDGDQAAEVSRRTNANFVVAMLRAAYIAVRKLGGEGGGSRGRKFGRAFIAPRGPRRLAQATSTTTRLSPLSRHMLNH
jgi:hypothetical protein